MDEVCRLCLADTTSSNEYTWYNQKIQLLMPEIDLNITSTVILCEDCSDNLNNAYTFKQKCLQIEECIQNYISATQTLLVNLRCVRDETYCDEIKVKIEEEFDDVENNSVINPTNSEDYKDINLISEEHNLTFPKEEIDHPYKDDPLSDYCKEEESLEAFLCEICTQSFKTLIELDQHRILHSETNKFPCDSCNKVFSRKIHLTQHKIIHSEGAIRFICDICNKGFKRKKYLVAHKATHNNKTQTCSICSRSCRNLEYHIRTVHTRRHNCKFCDKKFGLESRLLDHMRMHTGDYPYVCEVCGKGFVRKDQLNVHMYIHQTEKPYMCNICQKGYVLKVSLEAHMLVHVPNPEKPFVCEIITCSRRFKTRIDLRNHMRLHRLEKTHQCSMCDKSFSTSAYLRTHLKCHTGERPYECGTCHKRFTEKTNLAIHLKLHIPKKS